MGGFSGLGSFGGTGGLRDRFGGALLPGFPGTGTDPFGLFGGDKDDNGGNGGGSYGAANLGPVGQGPLTAYQPNYEQFWDPAGMLGVQPSFQSPWYISQDVQQQYPSQDVQQQYTPQTSSVPASALQAQINAKQTAVNSFQHVSPLDLTGDQRRALASAQDELAALQKAAGQTPKGIK